MRARKRRRVRCLDSSPRGLLRIHRDIAYDMSGYKLRMLLSNVFGNEIMVTRIFKEIIFRN